LAADPPVRGGPMMCDRSGLLRKQSVDVACAEGMRVLDELLAEETRHLPVVERLLVLV
jgi:hypothetical protein